MAKHDDRLEKLIDTLQRTVDNLQSMTRDHGPDYVAGKVDLDVAINTAENLAISTGAGKAQTGHTPSGQPPPDTLDHLDPEE